MDYNTSREKLVLPEYGRNIQNLVKYAISIEDEEERNKAAKTIVSIMGNMNPHLKDMSDFKHKLWDHITIIADFKLNVDSPYEKPQITTLREKPKKIPYNTNHIRFKHYGRTVEHLIEKACQFEEGEKKEALVEIIANHMKKAYLTWNREAITDEAIFTDIERLSKNTISVNRDLKLIEVKDVVKKQQHHHKKKTNKKRYK